MVAERFGPRATVDSLFDTYLQQPSPVFSTRSVLPLSLSSLFLSIFLS
jgi:hypothetical protein